MSFFGAIGFRGLISSHFEIFFPFFQKSRKIMSTRPKVPNVQFLAVIWDFFDVLHDFWSFELRQKTGYYGLHTFFEVSGRYLGVNLVFGLHHWSKKKDPKYALMCNFRIETTLTPPKIDVKLPMRAPWNRLITLITMVWLVFRFSGFFRAKKF